MVLINNLKKQVDIPVWEWCRFAPQVSQAASSSTSADNSTYHVSHGRYIYYLEDLTTIVGGTLTGKGFWRYDTVTDTYQQLAFPPIAPVTWSTMQFVGGQGYYGRVISATTNTITAAALTGQTLETFDIRITGGTGIGQHRVITGVSDPVIADSGVLVSVVMPGNVTDTSKNWTVNQWVGYQVRIIAATGNSQIRKILYNSSTTLYFADLGKFAEDANAYPPMVAVGGGGIVNPAANSQYQIESSTITVDSNWLIQPDATSRFLVHSGAIWLMSSGSTYNIMYYDIAADLWYIRNGSTGGVAGGPVGAGTDATITNTGEVALIVDRGTATSGSSVNILEDTTKSWAVNSLSGANCQIRIFSGKGAGQTRPVLSNTLTTITPTPVWDTAPDITSRYIIDTLDGGYGSTVSALNTNQTAIATSSTIFGNIFNAVAVSGGTGNAFYPGMILNTAAASTYTPPATGTMSTATVTTKMGACFSGGTSSLIILAMGDTTGIVAGMLVTNIATTGAVGGLNATAGTYVVSVTNNSITLSMPVSTQYSNGTLQFSTQYLSQPGATSNGSIITVSSTVGLTRGMLVSVASGSAGAFAVGTYVVDVISATTFYASAAPSPAFGTSVVVLGFPFQTVLINQISGTPGGVGTYTVWPSQTVAATTITGTGVATLTDTSQTWPLNRWNGQAVRITAGTGVGQVRSITGTRNNNTVVYTGTSASSVGSVISVTSVTNLVVGMQVTVSSAASTGAFAWNTTVTSKDIVANTFTVSTPPTTILSGATVIGTNNNTLIVTPAWTTPPDTTSSYVIHGDPDKLYFSFATQTPTFVHNIDSDTVTEGRMLDYGVARGASAQYADYPAVALMPATPPVPVQPLNYVFGNGTTAYYYFGMGPFLTTGFSATGGNVTLTFVSYPGSTYTGSTVIPVNSLITTSGIVSSNANFTNGDFVVLSSSAGSVTFTASGTGSLTTAGIISSGQKFVTGANSATVAGCVPTNYNLASFTSVAGTGAGVVAYTSTTLVGQLTTTGFIQQIPQAITSCNISGTTATLVLTVSAYYPIGSWVSIVGVVPPATGGSYNGVYQVVTSSSSQFTYNIPTNTPTGVATSVVGATVTSATTTQWVNTVNSHNFKAGYLVTHKGDSHYASSNTNITAQVYPVTVPGTLNQYIYSTYLNNYTSASGATSSGTTITVTSVVGLSVGMQVSVYSGVGAFATNTYVATIPSSTTFTVSTAPTIVLSGGASVVRGIQSTSYTSAAGASSSGTTITVTDVTGLAVGMQVAVLSGVGAFSNTSAVVTVTSINTTANTFVVTAVATPLTLVGLSVVRGWFLPTYTSDATSASSSGNVITVGGTIGVTGLTVGMQVIVTTAAGTGAFCPGTYVTSINPAANTFTVSTAPIPANGGAILSSATVRGSSYAGAQIVYTQMVSMLTDSTKNWVTNQYANCLVSFNTSQSGGTGTNPNVITALVIANTSTQLIFSNVYSTGYTAPVAGTSRYVITMPHCSMNGSVLGAADCGMCIGTESTTQIQDITKYWVMPANVPTITVSAVSGQAFLTLGAAVNGIFPGMVVVATSPVATTCIATNYNVSPAVIITVTSIVGLQVNLSGQLTGTTASTIFTFLATANSSGNTVTLSGFTTQGLSVGMYLGVSSVDNIKITTGGAMAVPVMGALVPNGGIILTNVQVTSITSATQFTISAVPTVPLLNANIFASAWFTNQWLGRKLRMTTGYTGSNNTNYQEYAILTTTNVGVNTFTASTTLTALNQVSGYAIFQQPVRGLGTALYWGFGQSDYSRRANYLFQARGGSVTGFDRLNLQNDYWDFLTPTPNYEVLGQGTMYAYDGGDRLYFTPAAATANSISQRVYYLDVDKMQIHGASYYPYIASAAVPFVGNRMEIFSTVDGLKYLWLNRHAGQECFKQLLFY